MIYLYNKTTGERLGQISAGQLSFLQAQMEEEYLEDQDYSVTPMTVDYFQTQGADPELLGLLRQALAGREEVIVVWREE